MRECKAFDLGALDTGGTVGDQREFDATGLQRIDGVMRAGEDEHLFFAECREAIGQPDREIGRKRRLARDRKCCKSALHHFLTRFREFQPPRSLSRGPKRPSRSQ